MLSSSVLLVHPPRRHWQRPGALTPPQRSSIRSAAVLVAASIVATLGLSLQRGTDSSDSAHVAQNSEVATQEMLRAAVLGHTVATTDHTTGHTLVTTQRDTSTRATMVLDSRPIGDSVRFDMSELVAGATAIELTGTEATVYGAAGNVLSQIATPWAVDATGAAVETYYSTDGLVLVQHLALSDATVFPVIADPQFTTGWTGLFVRWSRGEAKWLAGLSLAATAGALAVLCVGPHAIICGAAVGSIYYALASMSDWAVDQLYNRGCRIETRLIPYIHTYPKC